MTAVISGFGIQVLLKSSVTFPVGISLTQFADDADPFDIPSVQLADKAKGVNGDLIVWSKANPIVVTLNIIPGSDDDLNLSILAASNLPSRGKRNITDIVTLTGVYPQGDVITLTQGILTDAFIGKSVASAGRFKTKAYAFAFEDVQVS